MEKPGFWDRFFLSSISTEESLDRAANEINQASSDISELRRKVQDLLRSSGAAEKIIQTQAQEILQLKAIVQVLAETLVDSGTITTEALHERTHQRLTALLAPPPEPVKNAVRRRRRR